MQYLDANSLYGRAMPQKVPADGLEWVEDILIINKKIYTIYKTDKNYDEESFEGYIFEADVEYPINLHDLHSDSFSKNKN